MAKQIKFSDLIDVPSFEAFLTVLDTMKKSMSDIIALSSKTVGKGVPENASGMKEYATAIKQATDAKIAHEKIEQQELITQQKLEAAKKAAIATQREDLRLQNESQNAIKKQSAALEEGQKKFVSIRTEMRNCRNEMGALIQSGKGIDNPEVKILARKLEELTIVMKKTRTYAELMTKAGQFKAFTEGVRGVAAAFEIAQGASALFGKENEDIQKAMLKVQGAIALSHGLEEISKLLRADSLVMGSLEIAQTRAKTAAQTLYNTVVGESVGVMKAAKLAFAGLGIGLLIAGIVLLIENWDKLGLATKETTDAEKLHLATQKEIAEEEKKISGDLLKEKSNAEFLFKALENTNLAHGKRAALIDEINKSYGQYLPNLLTEQSTLQDIFIAQQNVTAAIEANIRAKLSEAKATGYEKEIMQLEDKNTAYNAYLSKLKEEQEYIKQWSTNGKMSDKYGDPQTIERWIQDEGEMNAYTKDAFAGFSSISEAMAHWNGKIKENNTSINQNQNIVNNLINQYVKITPQIYDHTQKTKDNTKAIDDATAAKLKAFEADQKLALSAFELETHTEEEKINFIIEQEKALNFFKFQLGIITQTEYEIQQNIITQTLYDSIKKRLDAEKKAAEESKKIQEKLLSDLDEDLAKASTKSISDKRDKLEAEYKDEIAAIDKKYKGISKADAAAQLEITNLKDAARNEYNIKSAALDDEAFKATLQAYADRIKAKRELEQKERDAALQAIDEYAKAAQDKRQRMFDSEIDQSKRHQDLLKDMAARGNQDAKNNLAMEEANQAKLEMKKEKALQHAKQVEAGLAILKTYSAALGKEGATPESAMKDTIKSEVLLAALIKAMPTFLLGTEDTGEGGNLDGKGGKLAKIHPHERILTAEQNKMVDGLSNWQLVNAGLMHKKELETMDSDRFMSNEKIYAKFDELKAEIKNKPVYLGNEYHKDSHQLCEMIEQGNSLVRNHKTLSKLG
jgi:hypothetical protein